MWIQNVSLADILKGRHLDPTNAILIQIVDPAMDFPKPKHKFQEVHKFEFWDLEGTDPVEFNESKITDKQAEQLACILLKALEYEKNIVVHCVAGICRSGAVAEVGVIMGFTDSGMRRQPNLLVKHKMMKILGYTYNEEE